MKTYTLQMTKTEVKPLTIEVEDLMSGETVTEATAVHTPPAGGSPTSITPTIAHPFVNLRVGPLAENGMHYILVQATGNGGSKPEVLYMVDVQ